MTAMIETFRGTVYPWQCDHMGHMNVMWYVGRFDEASWNLMSELTLNRARLQASERGVVAVDQRIAYVRELVAGDVVAVHTGVVDCGRRSIRFVHRMLRADSGETCAVTQLTGVYIDTRTRRACPLPDDVRRYALLRRVDVPVPWTSRPTYAAETA
jgi:acyl-CoA thioester hydrolase